MMRRFFLPAALFALGFLPLRGEEWSQFRGPDQGRSAVRGLPLKWSEKGENVRWSTAIPGQGWSSPVVGGGKVWMTTALDDGKSLRAVACDLATGQILHDVEVFRPEVIPAKHARNSYASPTPVLEGDRLYVDFGAMGTACLSTTDGRKLWENRTLVIDHQNGAGGSPILAGDHLLIACDGTDQQYGVALDKKTGQVVWKTVRSGLEKLRGQPKDHWKAYGTPVVFTLDGRPQSLTTAADRLYSYDPATGQELWVCDYKGFSNVPLPIFDGRQLYLVTGFHQREVLALKASGLQGNVTDSHVLWRQKTGGPDQSTPVVVGDRLYMVSSAGIASCLNTATGDVVWKERIGPDFAASPIAAEGRIYFFDTYSKCKVIAASDTFQELESNKLPDGCYATPAIAGKALLVRTKTKLYRLEL